jgi:hypothetical protein
MEWVARYLGACIRRDVKPFIARPTIGIQEYLLEPRQVFETSALSRRLKDNFLNATDKLIDGKSLLARRYSNAASAW